MRNKRKASPVFTRSSNKRREGWKNQYVLSSSDEEAISSDDVQEQTQEEEFEINGILDESESHYLIDWVGDYSPTWEPKEYASEVAIQVWKEKKQKEHSASETNTTSAEHSQAQPHSPVPEELAETPEQEPISQSPLDSPLFVPLEPVSQGTPEVSQPPLPGSATSSQSLADIRSPTKSLYRNVFDSYPRAPVPPEYCLPGEFEEVPDSVPQQTDSVRETSVQVTASSVPPERVSGDAVALRPRHNTLLQPATQTEIPETPSALLNLPLSQISQEDPQPRTVDTQKVVLSIDFPLSSLPSRPSLSNGHHQTADPYSTDTNSHRTPAGPSARYTSFVPESAPASTLQPLASQFLPTPAPLSASLTGPSASASTSKVLGTTRLPVLDSLSVTPQSAAVPVRSEASSGFISTRHQTNQASMDNQDQQKEGSSVAQMMEKYSHMEGSTPREKVGNAWAKLLQQGPFGSIGNDASATPSSFGDIEASEPPPVPETVEPLSVRVDKEPHVDATKESVPETIEETEKTHVSETIQTVQPSALSISQTEENPPGSLHLGPSEFAVPLPMDSRVKDDYERVLLKSIEEIKRIADTESQKSEQDDVVLAMQQVLERLSNAATHPDINQAQHMRDAEMNLEQEAAWAEYSSAKFQLLSIMIKIGAPQDMHLVIAVRGDKSQTVVERYLIGKGFSYTRPREEMGSGTNAEVSMANAGLSFGIQVASSDGIMETYKAPSAIIALDSSLDVKNPNVEHMRTTFARNGHLLPVIRLMIASSSEHVEQCFPGPSTPEHLLYLLRYSEQLRDIVGELQDDALSVPEDAADIMTCLCSENFNAIWALAPIEPLREESFSDETPAEENDESTVENEKPEVPQAQKRVFEEGTSEPSSKRPRMDESQDPSQQTASSKDDSQTLESQIQFLEKNLTEMQTSNENDLEKLKKALAAAQSRAHEAEQTLGMLQHRYEFRTNELHKIRKERDQLLETTATSNKRQEKQKEENSKLKGERTELKKDLEQARDALKAGGGDMAELENAREEIRRLTKDNASLERKADFANKQAEYTREQYQTASNVAAQTGNELRQVKEENESLKAKAAGEAVKLREINLQNNENRHLARIAELESTLLMRDNLLQRKEDELREIRKNRPSTRSTSTQPRSPKLNAGSLSRPTSPGPNNNNNNGVGRGSALRFSSDMMS